MEGDELWDVSPRHDCIFQSTPSAWRETRAFHDSIIARFISIHSLRMEGDRAISGDSWKRPAFQSTPSAWRETPEYCKRNQGKRYFNPLPPHGGRPVTEIVRLAMEIFQSTPSAWRETRKRRRCGHCGIFQSTPSAWRETIDLVDGDPAIIISIHSLRMEGDLFQATPMPEPLNFNPLPPHGGRPSQRLLHFAHNSFQSTPSAWRETELWDVSPRHDCIFQSTPSAWRETARY